MPDTRIPTAITLLLSAALLAACGGSPAREEEDTSSAALRASSAAVSMLGRPYLYGGSSPNGFDCSGLVRYSYARAGKKVPHSTDALRRAAEPVPASRLRKGDLLFFNQEGKRSSHVAIYIGNGSFVHAPSSGKRVRTDRLQDPYWSKHFAGARRLLGL
jgi:cell wall-associated NlpC family hydrolase